MNLKNSVLTMSLLMVFWISFNFYSFQNNVLIGEPFIGFHNLEKLNKTIYSESIVKFKGELTEDIIVELIENFKSKSGIENIFFELDKNIVHFIYLKKNQEKTITDFNLDIISSK